MARLAIFLEPYGLLELPADNCPTVLLPFFIQLFQHISLQNLRRLHSVEHKSE